MSAFELAALFLTLVAAGGWLNARTLRLPQGVAMLFVGLAGALVLAALHKLRPDLMGGAIEAVVRSRRCT